MRDTPADFDSEGWTGGNPGLSLVKETSFESDPNTVSWNPTTALSPNQTPTVVSSEGLFDAKPDRFEIDDEAIVQARLGVAAGLYTALKYKNPSMAAHVLRVALVASAWSDRLELTTPQRLSVEMAALLHDLGIIGLPDRILYKEERLTSEEQATLEHSRTVTVEILRHSCSDQTVLEIVEQIPAWFDGSRAGYPASGRAIPLGSRMIAIAESFDAMTHDRVYRAGRSREAAVGELFAYSGKQFDPMLTSSFVELIADHPDLLQEETARNWLARLHEPSDQSCWKMDFSRDQEPMADLSADRLYAERLLDNMRDAVIFIDTDFSIRRWNHGAEQLTGITGQTVEGRPWLPELLDLQDERGKPIAEQDCPVLITIRSGVQSLRRLRIRRRTNDFVSVDAQVIPVIGATGNTVGAVLVLHDASSEISLRQRCQSLHEKARRDPLTQLANRAEFDRVFDSFVVTHAGRRLPCSLIVCDLDLFKRVNDTFGHQAGDAIIRCISALLKNYCRPGDLVARYGGEEFVILCAECDNPTAADRAESIRKHLAKIPQEAMHGETVSASFGVTEIQPGDTPATMFRRADRALLMAKEQGRNRVVQLGTGLANKTNAACDPLSQGRPSDDDSTLVTDEFDSALPSKMVRQRIDAFLADRGARIRNEGPGRLRLEIDYTASHQNHRSDRKGTFLVLIDWENPVPTDNDRPRTGLDTPDQTAPTTHVRFAIFPKTRRNRRTNELRPLAEAILLGFRSYVCGIISPEKS